MAAHLRHMIYRKSWFIITKGLIWLVLNKAVIKINTQTL